MSKQEEIKNKTKEIIMNSRFYAFKGIGYNINKMGFLPKIGDNFNYKPINKIRVISHVLSNNFKDGRYYDSKFLDENNLKIKEGQYPVLIEAWKVTNEEFGYKDAYTISKFNIEQLTDESKKELEKILKEKEKFSKEKQFEFISKKYSLNKKELDLYMEEKNMDSIDKILFLGIIKAKTGTYLFLPKLTKEEKQDLIDNIDHNFDYLKEYIYRADINVNEYLKDRVLNKDEIDENKKKYEEYKESVGEVSFYNEKDKEIDEI